MNAFELIDSIFTTPLADGHIGITLRDGTFYEGYLLDYNTTAIQLGLGGPMSPDEPIQLPINAISSIHYTEDDSFTEHSVM